MKVGKAWKRTIPPEWSGLAFFGRNLFVSVFSSRRGTRPQADKETMSDAWGGKAGSSSTFDPLVVRQLLKDLERDVSEMERFYAGMDISTMQRHQQNATTRQRAYDTTNRLRALLQLPPRSGTQNDKDQILSQAQGLFQRFTDLQRRTMDVDGQIVTQMRRSLSSTYYSPQ